MLKLLFSKLGVEEDYITLKISITGMYAQQSDEWSLLFYLCHKSFHKWLVITSHQSSSVYLVVYYVANLASWNKSRLCGYGRCLI